MKHFMLDIEAMGTDFESDDIIQIALLELTKTNDGYTPGRSYTRTLHTSQKPKNDWIANTHKDLLEVCRKIPPVSAKTVRREILNFIKSCGVNEPAMIMGLNVTTFDIPYLVEKEFLLKPHQDQNNQLIGDYHYRIYELRGSYNLAEEVLGVDSKELFKRAEVQASDIELPNGKPHEALYDCYKQLKILNGCIRLLRQGRSHANP